MAIVFVAKQRVEINGVVELLKVSCDEAKSGKCPHAWQEEIRAGDVDFDAGCP